MSLIKKQQKKSSPSATKNVEATRTSLPEPSRTRPWELFGLIEKEFETIHNENTVRREYTSVLLCLLTKQIKWVCLVMGGCGHNMDVAWFIITLSSIN